MGARSKRNAAGCSHERLYAVYNGMLARCYNKKHHGYKNWGGRGIAVCDEWKYDYQAFKRWAIYAGYDENKDRKYQTLDRIDNDGNYCPKNCRWATQREQNKNQRTSKPYGRCRLFWTFDGITKSAEEWCDIFNVGKPMVMYRVNVKGMEPFEALTLPVTRGKNALNITVEQVLELRERGMTIKQIASFFGCSKHAIEDRLYKTKQKSETHKRRNDDI